MSVLALLKNGAPNSDRTRHIEIRYFFVADLIKRGLATIEYVPTKEMIADVLTKPLQGQLFKDLSSRLLGEK
jgi:hypothetical protein